MRLQKIVWGAADFQSSPTTRLPHPCRTPRSVLAYHRAIIDSMNIEKMLQELRAESAGVEQAIFVLERIASGRGPRRGRPPAWLSRAPSPTATEHKTFTRSAATRARMAASDGRRWGNAETGTILERFHQVKRLSSSRVSSPRKPSSVHSRSNVWKRLRFPNSMRKHSLHLPLLLK